MAEYNYIQKNYHTSIAYAQTASNLIPTYRYYGSVYGIRAIEAYTKDYDTIQPYLDYYIAPPENAYIDTPLFLANHDILKVFLEYEYEEFFTPLEFKYLSLLFHFEMGTRLYPDYRETLYANYKSLNTYEPEKLITLAYTLEISGAMTYIQVPITRYIDKKVKDKNHVMKKVYRENLPKYIERYNTSLVKASKLDYMFNHLESALLTARTIYYVDHSLANYPEIKPYIYPHFNDTKAHLVTLVEKLSPHQKSYPKLTQALEYINGCLK